MLTIKIFTATLIVVSCAMLPAKSPAQAMGRTVFLDLERVFSSFNRTQAADAQLKRQAEEFNKERSEMVAALQAIDEEHNALRERSLNEALDPQVREALTTDVEQKLEELRELESRIMSFDELRTKQLEEQGRRMRRNIVDEVRRRISEHARDQGYVAVIDASGNSLNNVPNVLYFDPRHDITDEIIELLNR